MKILIDTCVLYPTVMREVLLAVAATGAFEPVWSARILEEWARAAIKLEPDGFLVQHWQSHPQAVEEAALGVLDQARRLSGKSWDMRPLLKKARLPRLAKALTSQPKSL